MLEDHNNQEWNRNRAKFIVDHFGYQFFYGKRILDLGSGHGEIAEVFARLGADITCVDAREDNLNVIAKKYPHIITKRVDLDNDFPFVFDQYDVVLSLGVLCHLKNYDKHIKDICSIAEHIVLETEVFDSDDPGIRVPIYEEKILNDLSFHGIGSIVSASNIQNMISQLGATFQRKDSNKINSGIYTYDWNETNGGRRVGNRRIWFIKSDKFIQLKLDNQKRVELAEIEIANRPIPIPRPAMAPDHPNLIHKKLPPPISPRNLPHIQASSYPYKVRLFYNYYEDKNPTRKSEIDFCLSKNIDNPLFDTIIIESPNNPTFNFMFEKINRLSKDDDINIICNTDIFFDDTIRLIRAIKSKEVFALSRYNYVNDRTIIFSDEDNQDAWIFRGKIGNINCDFQMGKPGCDGRLAYELQKTGYIITNPSKSIRCFHVHNSGIRSYTEVDRIQGEYLCIKPTHL
jgi:SAM-dependent methyltransferase